MRGKMNRCFLNVAFTTWCHAVFVVYPGEAILN
ncbi:MAG: hypothetical protein RLZZ370_558 [Bacteroidota bacterium]